MSTLDQTAPPSGGASARGPAASRLGTAPPSNGSSARGPAASRRALRPLLLAFGLLAACDKGPPVKTEATVAAPATKPTEAAAAPAAPAGTTFGEGVTLTSAEPIAAILANPKSYVGKTVRVEGMVTDVCPKRGCWMELAGSEPGQKLKFKVTDGVMTFPADAKGKKAVAQGVIAVRDMTLDETKENAEYEAKEYGKPYDPASITEPRSIVRLDGTGAIIQ